MLIFKTSCAVLANLSSNLLNEVGLSLFRYFEVGLRLCDIVLNKYVRYLISWWVLVIHTMEIVRWKNKQSAFKQLYDRWCRMSLWERKMPGCRFTAGLRQSSTYAPFTDRSERERAPTPGKSPSNWRICGKSGGGLIKTRRSRGTAGADIAFWECEGIWDSLSLTLVERGSEAARQLKELNENDLCVGRRLE